MISGPDNIMQLQIDLCPFKVTHTGFSGISTFSLAGTVFQPLTKPNMGKSVYFLHSLPHKYTHTYLDILHGIVSGLVPFPDDMAPFYLETTLSQCTRPTWASITDQCYGTDS